MSARLCWRERLRRIMPVALSLCMIVKNEGLNLPACLDSVQGLAGELIVVDTGSTDGTADVARRYGADSGCD